MPHWMKHYLAPQHCYQIISKMLVCVVFLAFCMLALGLYTGLILAPADYQQGDAVRIMYIHVPSAYMAMFVYCVMAVMALIFFSLAN